MDGYRQIKLILHGGNKIEATYILPISRLKKLNFMEIGIFASRGFTIHFSPLKVGADSKLLANEDGRQITLSNEQYFANTRHHFHFFFNNF